MSRKNSEAKTYNLARQKGINIASAQLRTKDIIKKISKKNDYCFLTKHSEITQVAGIFWVVDKFGTRSTKDKPARILQKYSGVLIGGTCRITPQISDKVNSSHITST